MKRIPKRFYVYALLILFICLWPFRPGPRPLQVTLTGTAAEMGTQLGKQYRTRIRLLLRVYLQGVICRNDARVFAEGCRRAAACRAFISPAYIEETEALAKAADVSADAVLFGNSFIDLGYAAGACRSIVAASPTGLLHAHNLDWDSVGGLADWNICILRRNPSDGRQRTVTIGLPGMIGALDIINEHGIALSLNMVGARNVRPAEPVFILLRRIAENCATFDEARTALLKASPDMPFIVTLSSAAEGKGAVFEPWGDQLHERPLEGAFVAAENSLTGDGPGNGPVQDTLKTLDLRTVTGMEAALRHPNVLLSCNIYSVIFDYTGNRFLLASGKTPAAKLRYREFKLFAPPREADTEQ